MTQQPSQQDLTAAYWEGYAAGLADRAQPRNPRGWLFLAAVAACLLIWTLTIATVVWLA